jgi:Fe2+ or Zn2+ uptake regulation protein
VTTILKSAAQAAGFTPKSPVIEITGICTHCRA